LSAVTAIKRTRQTLSEKLGRGTKTIDAELEARVESLRMIQKRYSDVMQLARAFSTHFSALVNCQQALAVEFSDLAQKMPELRSEFAYNAETQRALFKNGETLLGKCWILYR
jgi:DNA repair ATPase RecN